MGWRKTPAEKAADKKAKDQAKAKKDLANIAEGQRIAKARAAEKKKADRVAAQREKREQRRRNQGK